jgi:hypothetical protein
MAQLYEISIYKTIKLYMGGGNPLLSGGRKFKGWKNNVPPSIPLRKRVSGAWWKVERTFKKPL